MKKKKTRFHAQRNLANFAPDVSLFDSGLFVLSTSASICHISAHLAFLAWFRQGRCKGKTDQVVEYLVVQPLQLLWSWGSYSWDGHHWICRIVILCYHFPKGSNKERKTEALDLSTLSLV
ncbi:hypothetical protein PoB_002175500 [Plakobranchus ocellatus]|uniref:Uncharacterized protein n=1 Tax=Plakobranchus ocellatus TaxID=259542 RepID=A0AAV3ZJD8_9GAST|nr:hypothetical protein PoB_002175500 [Plakobranchus ocellatus]